MIDNTSKEKPDSRAVADNTTMKSRFRSLDLPPEKAHTRRRPRLRTGRIGFIAVFPLRERADGARLPGVLSGLAGFLRRRVAAGPDNHHREANYKHREREQLSAGERAEIESGLGIRLADKFDQKTK
jgi:hypothetical protein